MTARSATSDLWRPRRTPIFRQLLLADVVSDIGTLMQGVGSAWLMVSIGASPLLIALTQTASRVPVFLFALPVVILFTLNPKDERPEYDRYRRRNVLTGLI